MNWTIVIPEAQSRDIGGAVNRDGDWQTADVTCPHVPLFYSLQPQQSHHSRQSATSTAESQ